LRTWWGAWRTCCGTCPSTAPTTRRRTAAPAACSSSSSRGGSVIWLTTCLRSPGADAFCGRACSVLVRGAVFHCLSMPAELTPCGHCLSMPADVTACGCLNWNWFAAGGRSQYYAVHVFGRGCGIRCCASAWMVPAALLHGWCLQFKPTAAWAWHYWHASRSYGTAATSTEIADLCRCREAGSGMCEQQWQ
jgi:hypothetical protein